MVLVVDLCCLGFAILCCVLFLVVRLGVCCLFCWCAVFCVVVVVVVGVAVVFVFLCFFGVFGWCLLVCVVFLFCVFVFGCAPFWS